MSSRCHAMKWTLGAALAVVLAAFVPAVHAQDVPIDIAVSGDTVPGGAVTVTLTTTDGSTIQSVAWEQVYGVTAALSGDNPLTVTLGPVAEYKTHLFHVLAEPPVGAGYGAVMNALAAAVGDEVFRRTPVTADVILNALENNGTRTHEALTAHI